MSIKKWEENEHSTNWFGNKSTKLNRLKRKRALRTKTRFLFREQWLNERYHFSLPSLFFVQLKEFCHWRNKQPIEFYRSHILICDRSIETAQFVLTDREWYFDTILSIQVSSRTNDVSVVIETQIICLYLVTRQV